jgi:hypothetical protein
MLFEEKTCVHWHSAVKRFDTYILALSGYNILFDRITNYFLPFLVLFSMSLSLSLSLSRSLSTSVPLVIVNR